MIMEKSEQLIQASTGRLSNQVAALLRDGADPNFKNWTGWTALSIACASGNKDVVETIIGSRAKITEENLRDSLLISSLFSRFIGPGIGNGIIVILRNEMQRCRYHIENDTEALFEPDYVI